MDEKRLDGIAFFAKLSKNERREVARHADEVDVPAGKHLVNEGRFAYEFFVIEEGTAEVLRGDEHVADLGPGDVFGEMGARDDVPRTASVIAKTPMTAIVMSARDFRQMTRSMPALAEQIQATIEARSQPLMR